MLGYGEGKRSRFVFFLKKKIYGMLVIVNRKMTTANVLYYYPCRWSWKNHDDYSGNTNVHRS